MKINFDIENGIPYVDNAVTTPLGEKILEAMLPFLEERFADPSEPYEPGLQASESLEGFREQIADMVGAKTENVWFTSGGTESNNWVLSRIRKVGAVKVGTKVEHLSVYKNVTSHADVDSDGVVKESDLRDLLALGDVSIVSIQHANQETGVIQEIPYLSEVCKEYSVPLHVDAAMSFGIIPVDLFDLGANFVTLSSHKIWGPVGAGALVSDGSYELHPFMFGGEQEGGMRAGPVNMAAIAGFAAAAETMRTSSNQWKEVEKMRNSMELSLKTTVNARVAGENASRLPNMSSLTFDGSDATFLAAELERMYGMCIGVGGAAEDGTSSRVLQAMGMDRPGREATVRLRFSPWLKKQDADQIMVGICSALKAEQVRAIM